jgi:hypothetical protein
MKMEAHVLEKRWYPHIRLQGVRRLQSEVVYNPLTNMVCLSYRGRKLTTIETNILWSSEIRFVLSLICRCVANNN